MKEYHDHEQPLIFKACPGCRADLEQYTAECQFCDHQFFDEVYAKEREPHELPENESSPLGNMVALNVALSLLSALLPAWESFPEQRRTDQPSYHMSAQDREAFIQFHKAVTLRRNAASFQCGMKLNSTPETNSEILTVVND